MGAGDEEDVEDLAVPEGLVDLVSGGDEHEAGKKNGEDGKCCAVEYAEKWYIGDVHSLRPIAMNSMGIKMLLSGDCIMETPKSPSRVWPMKVNWRLIWKRQGFGGHTPTLP